MLFSGTSHPRLADEIAKCLGVNLGLSQIEAFSDGEIGVQVLESVRGRDVFVVQSASKNPNYYLMELLIFVDALKRASARSITAVLPYFAYSRQECSWIFPIGHSCWNKRSTLPYPSWPAKSNIVTPCDRAGGCECVCLIVDKHA